MGCALHPCWHNSIGESFQDVLQSSNVFAPNMQLHYFTKHVSFLWYLERLGIFFFFFSIFYVKFVSNRFWALWKVISKWTSCWRVSMEQGAEVSPEQMWVMSASVTESRCRNSTFEFSIGESISEVRCRSVEVSVTELKKKHCRAQLWYSIVCSDKKGWS